MSEVPHPDNFFWYAFAVALTSILGTVLVIVITRYVNKTDENFKLLTSICDALRDSNKDMKAMLMLHEHRLNGHDDDIKTVESYIVKNRK